MKSRAVLWMYFYRIQLWGKTNAPNCSRAQIFFAELRTALFSECGFCRPFLYCPTGRPYWKMGQSLTLNLTPWNRSLLHCSTIKTSEGFPHFEGDSCMSCMWPRTQPPLSAVLCGRFSVDLAGWGCRFIVELKRFTELERLRDNETLERRKNVWPYLIVE